MQKEALPCLAAACPQAGRTAYCPSRTRRRLVSLSSGPRSNAQTKETSSQCGEAALPTCVVHFKAAGISVVTTPGQGPRKTIAEASAADGVGGWGSEHQVCVAQPPVRCPEPRARRTDGPPPSHARLQVAHGCGVDIVLGCGSGSCGVCEVRSRRCLCGAATPTSTQPRRRLERRPAGPPGRLERRSRSRSWRTGRTWTPHRRSYGRAWPGSPRGMRGLRLMRWQMPSGAATLCDARAAGGPSAARCRCCLFSCSPCGASCCCCSLLAHSVIVYLLNKLYWYTHTLASGTLAAQHSMLLSRLGTLRCCSVWLPLGRRRPRRRRRLERHACTARQVTNVDARSRQGARRRDGTRELCAAAQGSAQRRWRGSPPMPWPYGIMPGMPMPCITPPGIPIIPMSMPPMGPPIPAAGIESSRPQSARRSRAGRGCGGCRPAQLPACRSAGCCGGGGGAD